MQTIRRLLAFAGKYWHWILLNAISMLVVTGLGIALPQIQAVAIDRSLILKHYGLLPYLALAIVGAAVVKGLFQFGVLYMTEYVAQKTVYDIRNKLFDHIQRLSFSYHDEAETGQLISRATADVDMVRQFLGSGMYHLFVNGLMLVGVIAMCFHMSWRLSLVSLSIMPLLVGTVVRFRILVRPIFVGIQEQTGEMTAAIQQNLMGIRVVKAFAREDHEVGKFDKQAYSLLDRNIAWSKVAAVHQPFLDFLTFAGMLLILWYGGRQVIRHDLRIGELVAFYTYLGMIAMPVRILGWVVMITQYAIVSADRVFEILDTHPETQLKDGTVHLRDCKGDVEFRNVSFTYGDGSRVLSNISLQVKSGEMVAFVGATGSGKSTIINLLPRFYDVTDGALLIDGMDIRQYKLASLRRHIGIVSQETFLFGDTARENIAYGKPNALMEDVIRAAKSANIHDFIMSLPDQYDTKIGERGVNLSGGQKQRIAISRALLMNPPILILDDSTSSVDTETESLIQQALVSLTESRTTFVVAQRVSTIKRANKIVVLDKGRVVECGTHEELLANGGEYAEIYHMQFGGQETLGV